MMEPCCWREHLHALAPDGHERPDDRRNILVVRVLARLHYELVAIHPFLNGNGRLARFATDQAARELLGRTVGRGLTQQRERYFAALHSGINGNLEPLEQIIRAALI